MAETKPELAALNWSSPAKNGDVSNNKHDTMLGILFMSYLVFGSLAVYLWPLAILHFGGLKLTVVAISIFPLLWVVGLHYLIKWMKKYG